MKIMNNAGNSQDEKFLQELHQIILDNLQNEQFSVEVLAQIKGVSRSHLHRKLKVLKKQSISQYIREIKLKEAMKLLQVDAANVSEIAYMVGFSSTSYFNTCFHGYYGFPPGEVKKRNQNRSYKANPQTSKRFQSTEISHQTSQEPSFLGAPKSKYSVRTKRLMLFSVLLAVVLGAAYFINWVGSDQELTPSPSIAILPLDHLSDRPDQEYLTAGIHDALIGELGTIQGLRVISRTSTLRYPNSNLLIQEIAEELDVDVIIEGSVVITGDSLRLQLQLIEAFPLERHLWAQEYYQDVPNILSLQSKVIEDIAQSIQHRLSSSEKKRLAATGKVDPETYKAYLRGIYFLNKSTPEEFQKGLDYLHQAIEVDPASPYAYAGLAEGYAALGHGPDPSNTYWQRGKAAALRAIELDSTLAKAHAALGLIKLYYEGDWQGAEQAFTKAHTINPNLAFNHFHFAWYQVIFGQKDLAIEHNIIAKELDPLTPIFSADMGTMYYWFGAYDQAIVELKQALELDQNFGHAWWSLGNVYLKKGWHNQAVEAHLKAADIHPAWKWALANTYVQTGDKGKALEIVAELKSKPITPRVAFGLMRIYVSLGDLDEAFYWLEFQTPDVWIPWTRTWPGLESLRKDPRYEVFLRKKNLPPLAPSAT